MLLIMKPPGLLIIIIIIENHLSDTVLTFLIKLLNLIPTTMNSKAQMSWVTCLRSHSLYVVETI